MQSKYSTKSPTQKAAAYKYLKDWRARDAARTDSTERQYRIMQRSLLMSGDWATLVRHYGSCCLRCTSDVPWIAHVQPLLVDSDASNCLANLQPLCAACVKAQAGRVVDHRPDAGAWILATFPDALVPFTEPKHFVEHD